MTKAIELVTGGNYKLPHRNKFPELLEEIYQTERQTMRREMKGQFGTLMFDGWSPDHGNEGIISSSFASPSQCHLLNSQLVDENGADASVQGGSFKMSHQEKSAEQPFSLLQLLEYNGTLLYIFTGDFVSDLDANKHAVKMSMACMLRC